MNLVQLSLVLAAACVTAGVTLDAAALKHIANVTYALDNTKSGLPSIFSPRMDFEQWKPLTGRGDPLRNDPTYDYEPPVVDPVHYWADDTRPDVPPPLKPERKSEVLVLGVSSRRPSLIARQPARHQPPSKYEDFSYKLGDHYPMTILVPPPPPRGHPPLYLLTDEKLTTPHHTMKPTEPVTPPATEDPARLTALYALQEANLIYSSSTVSQNWAQSDSQNGTFSENAVSSDYAGWGPTTPFSEEDSNNETNNFIFNDQFEVSKHPYSFYRPMLSEAPPPPRYTPNPLLLPTYVPTASPVKSTTQSLVDYSHEITTTETSYYDDITTANRDNFRPTPVPSTNTKPDTTNFDMLGPMMSMPMANGPDRPEDHLYAHASENLHVYTEHPPIDVVAELESMQTMQPPPPGKTTQSTSKYSDQFKINPNVVNGLLHKETFKHNTIMTDPYLQSRFTSPMPTVASKINVNENIISTTETSATPMYLIIQGHSKVKSYSSKSKPVADSKETLDNEISKQKGNQQVKHLHPIKEKFSAKKVDKSDNDRIKHARNLKTLLSDGVGKIDIQETDVGIKYDVSDGSDVPVEIYKKGIVESDENNYSSNKKLIRTKRDFHLEDFLPFDEETLDQFVSNYLNRKKNFTGTLNKYAKVVKENPGHVDRKKVHNYFYKRKNKKVTTESADDDEDDADDEEYEE